MKHTLKIRLKKQIVFIAIFNLSVLLGYGQLLPTVVNLNRYVEGKIVLVNDQEIDGFVQIPDKPLMMNVKYKQGKDSKAETLKSNSVKTLILKNDDGSNVVLENLYVNMNYKNPDVQKLWGYPQFLLKSQEGYITVYETSDKYRRKRSSGKIVPVSKSYIENADGSTRQIDYSDYYIRSSDTTAVYFATTQWSKKKIRKQCLSRFGDCQEVVDFIERGGGKGDDLEYIFKVYNKFKAKEFPEKEVPKLEKNNPELPQW